MASLHFTGQEVLFSPDEIIVSKTDCTGRLTYVNQTFCSVSGYKETELLGQPHSLIRHANMPRCVFKLIWDRIQTGREIFGYVVNRTINHDYYWVLAHVTPSYDDNNAIIGYHSNRRVPDKNVIDSAISPLYAELLAIENKTASRKDGLLQSYDYLTQLMNEKGLDYDEFILTL